jgi:hypothetical protein
MTANDIIERNAECARRLLEAGAEIERLRAERLAFATESEERKADNERLRAALEVVWGSGAVAGLSCEEQVRRAMDHGLPTADDVRGILKEQKS